MQRIIPWLGSALLTVTLAGCGSSSDSDHGVTPPPAPKAVTLSLAGRYSTGTFEQSAAEIPAFDTTGQRIFMVNAQSGQVDVLDASNPAQLNRQTVLDVTAVVPGATVNSIAIHGNLLAVAIEPVLKTDPGTLALYRLDNLEQPISTVPVGALPDMVTFTPDGGYVLVANEGEPSDDYQIDPEGSVSVVAVSDPLNPQVRTADFHAFNDQAAQLRAKGVRLYGPHASVAQDLEPEYIAVAADSRTAWVALQENNALAKIDIATATITDIVPLGFKDHGADGNGLDVSDEPLAPEVRTWQGVLGMYQPDAIAAYQVAGSTYILSANEGDARAWGEDNPDYFKAGACGDADQGFVEELRVKHLVHSKGFARRCGDDMPPQLMALANGALLNPEVFSYCGATAGDAGLCREDDQLGRLKISWVQGYRTDEAGAPVMFNAQGEQDAHGDRLMYDQLYAYGARSFSIWSADGALVWDSGDQFEQFLLSDQCKLGSARNIDCASYFNSGHNAPGKARARSTGKGPEPEGVAVGTIEGRQYAFIGLERMGGVMLYDITDPNAPVFKDYLNSRDDWDQDPAVALEAAGDLGPEGLVFVPAEQTPDGKPWVIVGNEVSGTTAVFHVELTH
ncbi:choice-of-anchor I family protein [Isoalcanivorax beigongshangi]|uniref:Choice-of-anchor I family protein n=1 Tax=Isoalcanivorax beigongshangi TaxID=3238810 RepID=A0ABV4AL13_9GAMM